jgi:hypothetical protein
MSDFVFLLFPLSEPVFTGRNGTFLFYSPSHTELILIFAQNMKQQVRLASLQMNAQVGAAVCNTMQQAGVSFANAAMSANATSHYELVNRNTRW